MDINIKNSNRIYEFNYPIDNTTFELEDSTGRIKDQLYVKGKLEKLVQDKLILRFSVTGEMIYPRSRCLEDVTEEINYSFEEEIEPTNDGVINLDTFVNDCLYINEPYKVLCKEDCKGLCPVCGTNLNISQCHCQEEEEIDPRFEKLKNLF